MMAKSKACSAAVLALVALMSAQSIGSVYISTPSHTRSPLPVAKTALRGAPSFRSVERAESNYEASPLEELTNAGMLLFALQTLALTLKGIFMAPMLTVLAIGVFFGCLQVVKAARASMTPFAECAMTSWAFMTWLASTIPQVIEAFVTLVVFCMMVIWETPGWVSKVARDVDASVHHHEDTKLILPKSRAAAASRALHEYRMAVLNINFNMDRAPLSSYAIGTCLRIKAGA